MRKRKTGAKQTRLIKSFFREVSALFAASLFFSMLNTGLNALTPQIVRVTVDSVIEGKASGLPVMDRLQNTPDRALLLAAVAILLVSAASGVCGYLGRTDAAKASEGFIQSLRDHLFGHIQRLPFSWHDTHRTGDIIQRCTSDVEVIRSFVSTQLLEVFRTVFLVAVSL